MAQIQNIPLVSVIVPVHNGAKFLANALDSIFSQTYDSIEVIVVDDGSSDTTPEVALLCKSKIKYIHQENQGPAAARNKGIQQARGSLLAFLDSDDIWMPEKLQEQVAYLDSHQEISCVAVKLRHFVEPSAKGLVNLRPEWLDEERTSRMLSCLIVRKIVFDQVGLFDPKLRFGEDVEWLLRLDRAGIMCPAIEHVLVHKRIHDNNVSHQTAAMTSDTLAVLRRNIKQRRKVTE